MKQYIILAISTNKNSNSAVMCNDITGFTYTYMNLKIFHCCCMEVSIPVLNCCQGHVLNTRRSLYSAVMFNQPKKENNNQY
jgi:hypothetical protein